MIKSYYITAARQLSVITEDSGYSITDDDFIVTPSGSKIKVSDQVKTRAKYLVDLAKIRTTRDLLISTTDWVGFTDAPNSEMKTQLIEYRQQLRDITNQVIEGQDLDITWPADPRLITATNTYATSAYGQANTATTLAQASFNTANSIIKS